MEKRVNFNSPTTFLGRNGEFTSVALDIFTWDEGDDTAVISPITSKGHIGRCHIHIPKDKIDELCNILKQFKNEKDS